MTNTIEKLTPAEIIHANAVCAWDQRNARDYGGPREAFEAYMDNVNDTLVEYGYADYGPSFTEYRAEWAKLAGLDVAKLVGISDAQFDKLAKRASKKADRAGR